MPDTETLTEEQLKEIEARYTKATAGPWDWTIFKDAPDDVIALTSPASDVLLCTGDSDQSWGEINDDDAAFIAHAREDVPALCRSLRAAWQWKREALPLLTSYDNLAGTFDGRLGSSKVANLERGVAALRQQLATQAESITYFQENEKKLKAQLAEARQQRDGWERARRDDERTFERIAASIGMSWCCMAETMELESRIERVVEERDELKAQVAQVEQERNALRLNAVNLCKAKAADYAHDPTTAHVLTAIAGRLENL